MDTSEFCQSIIIELIKGIITFSLGFISFKIFEGYRNRKDNNRLYIQIKKLERELKENKSKIESVLNEYIEREVLEENFYLNGNYSNELYKLYNDVTQLSYNYIRTGHYYRGNEPVWYEDYVDNPYSLIENTIYEIRDLETREWQNLDRIRDLKELLIVYENQNIYDEFIDIQQQAMALLDKEFNSKKPIIFLNNVLREFNLLTKEEKHNKLQSFCTMLFNGDNIFTNCLDVFKRLEYLKIKQNPKNKDSKISITFNLLETSDMDLLAYYNADVYIKLDELYSRLNATEPQINCGDTLIKVQGILDNELDPIINELKNKFEKIIKRINK